VQEASVSLDVLLATRAHPLLRVGGEAGSVADLVLASSVDDALARLSEQVIEVQPVADVLLRDLVSKAHVGAQEVMEGLLALGLGGVSGLIDADASNLLGLAEDDSGGGEGRKKCSHGILRGC